MVTPAEPQHIFVQFIQPQNDEGEAASLRKSSATGPEKKAKNFGC